MPFDARQELNTLISSGRLDEMLVATRIKTAAPAEKVDLVLEDAVRTSTALKQAMVERQTRRQAKVAAVRTMLHVGRRLSAAGILTAV